MPLNKQIKKVLVIGSGPIVIGQAAEFDYAGTQSCIALKEEGLEVVLVNSNPATIMTDKEIADKIYMEPLTVESLEVIIKKERPDGIIGTLGGQTGLNLVVQLEEERILEKYNVKLLGTSVPSIQQGEDREKFRQLMLDINEPIPQSKIVHTEQEGLNFAKEIGFPVIVRPAYTLGGEGGGFANSSIELQQLLKRGLSLSPIHQVLLEKSIKGWKEIEYEVMRDANDTCIIVCNMENMDPVGVHTGDSIVVAPSQTLSDVQYQILRNASLKVIRALKIIGGCNIQFAFHPESNEYFIIEVNPRVSRSSALASKATGYPIARIATKCAVGYHLDEIINPITGNTFTSFEPALDYVVVKLPRFPFDKFTEADRTLGTQMKATGEVLSIDRSFEGAMNKAIRSLEMNVKGLKTNKLSNKNLDEIKNLLETPNDYRLFAIAEGLQRGMSIEELHKLTEINEWFLQKLNGMVLLEEQLATFTIDTVTKELLTLAKYQNISDEYLSELLSCSIEEVKEKREAFGLKPAFKLVDTCAAEFDALTPYYYSTWSGVDEVEVSNKEKALVIGSGPIRIGQGIEFDYCSVHAVKALKKLGLETVVVNNNPETVSTDFSIADKLYFEPLTVEDIINVIEKENVNYVFIQFGGQTAINLAAALKEKGINVVGTNVENIDQLEDRQQFYQLLDEINIPHMEGEIVYDINSLKDAAAKIGYPVLVRPSYVIGGQSMYTFYAEDELSFYIEHLKEENYHVWPLLVDQFVPGTECELDVVSDGKNIYIPAIFEHVEKAGVHSGDSIAVFPPVQLSKEIQEVLVDYTKRICEGASIVGLANIQFIIKNSTVYCLEVNPRASRTIPIVSKVTGVNLVDLAVKAQLGNELVEVGLKEFPDFYSVKAPIFSATKLKGVDHVLGPEMKSTGEVLGLGLSYEEALYKALFYKENPFDQTDNKCFLLSVTEREKENVVSIAMKLIEKGFSIVATEGTAKYLLQKGIKTKRYEEAIFLKEEIAGAIIIPTKGRNLIRLGAKLRELCTRYQVPCFTSLDTASEAIKLNEVNRDFRSMKDYYKHQVEGEDQYATNISEYKS